MAPSHSPARRSKSPHAHAEGLAGPPGGAPDRGATSAGCGATVLARRRLDFGEPDQASALQAAQALLRHPPITVQEGSPVGPWLQEVAGLVDVAFRRRPSEVTRSSSGRGCSRGSRPTATPSQSWNHTSGGAGGLPRSIPASRTAPSEDLRHVIDHRRRNEDARVAIERRRERRQPGGVDEDQASSGPTQQYTRAPAAPRPAAPSYGVGCQALSPELRRVRWPGKFRPDLSQRYDGSFDPVEFLQLYTTAVQAAGGTRR